MNNFGTNNAFRKFCVSVEHVFFFSDTCKKFVTPTVYPVGNYMFKVDKRNTRTKCEVFSKLTIETPELRQWRHWRRSVVFIVNFEYLYFTPPSSASVVNFKQLNAS